MTTKAKDFDPNAYSITVRREVVDDELQFVATVTELPSVSAIGDTYSDAYDMVIDAIATLFESSKAMGHPFPEPSAASSPDYSGRVTLRMPPWLHAQLDLEAKRDDVSLNQTIVTLLASRVTGYGIVKDAGASIERAVETAFVHAMLMRGNGTPIAIDSPLVGYSSMRSKTMPEMENEKWTFQA